MAAHCHGFNSKMVRLRLSDIALLSPPYFRFNSNNEVAIAAAVGVSPLEKEFVVITSDVIPMVVVGRNKQLIFVPNFSQVGAQHEALFGIRIFTAPVRPVKSSSGFVWIMNKTNKMYKFYDADFCCRV